MLTSIKGQVYVVLQEQHSNQWAIKLKLKEEGEEKKGLIAAQGRLSPIIYVIYYNFQGIKLI